MARHISGRDLVAIPHDYLTEFIRSPMDSIIKYGALPQRGRSLWITEPEKVRACTILPNLITGPDAQLRASGMDEWNVGIAHPHMDTLIGAITPDYIGHRTDWQSAAWHVHCFPGDTMVDAISPRRIADVRVGESIIASDGSKQSVIEVMQRQCSDGLVEIKAEGQMSVRCTPEHPILVLRRPRAQSGKPYPRTHHFVRDYYDTAEPEWVAASEVQVDDFVLAPRLEFSGGVEPIAAATPNPMNRRRTPIRIEASDDLAWLVGLFAGDGHTSAKGGFGFTLSDDNHVARAVQIMQMVGVKVRVTNHKSFTRIAGVSVLFADTMRAWCGSGAHDKKLPEWVMSTREFAAAALDGLCCADGWLDGERGRQTLVSVSEVLARQAWHIALSLGHAPCITSHKTGDSGYKPGAGYFRVLWQEKRAHQGAFHWRQWLASPVRRVERVDFDGPVYNLSVSGPQTYVANGIAVHNCDPGLNRGRKGDASAIAVGRIVDQVDITYGGEARRVNRYVIPIVMQVMAPEYGEITLSSLTRFILQLRGQLMINITSFSYDGFQSAGSIQELTAAGLVTAGVKMDEFGRLVGFGKPYSVDRSAHAHQELKEAMNETRILLPDYHPIAYELNRLEDIPGRAPDHPPAGCFTGETRVPLLDGTTPMISELAGRQAWVYSCTPAGDLVPGLARGRMTKMVRELIDVTLDDGRVVRCTPEHLWMLRDGSYKEAQSLRPGLDRLMPCKRSMDAYGYERYSSPSGARSWTHRMIAAFKGPIPDGHIVHHINENRLDNRPENLEVLAHRDHTRHHAIQNHQKVPNWRKAMSEGTRRFNANRDYSHMRGSSNSRWRDISIEQLPTSGTVRQACEALGIADRVLYRVLRAHGFDGWLDWLSRGGINHKVKRIDRVLLDEPVPVYDLEVDVWSNFALDCGVFVHNSKDCADAVAGVVGYLAEIGHAVFVPPKEMNVSMFDLPMMNGVKAPNGAFMHDAEMARLSIE